MYLCSCKTNKIQTIQDFCYDCKVTKYSRDVQAFERKRASAPLHYVCIRTIWAFPDPPQAWFGETQGVSALQLIISLCLFRFNGASIFGMYRRDFHSLVDTGKNCYYRMMSRETMDWRTLLLRMCIRFFAILRKEHAEENDQPRCYIIDDTTLEKTGVSIEGITVCLTT